MITSSVRHLATTPSGWFLAVATSGGLVSVWDLRAGQKINEFQTCLDYGGRRLAISQDGMAYAASFDHREIEGYNIRDGSVVWRNFLKSGPQTITVDPKAGSVNVCTEDNRIIAFDPSDGIRIRERDAKAIFFSPESEYELVERKKEFDVIESNSGKTRFSINKEDFAILSAAFLPKSLVVSEARKGLRVFNLETAAVVWKFQAPDGWHFLKVTYCEKLARIFGVLWEYQSSGEKKLLSFDLLGKLYFEMDLIPNPAETEFAKDGSLLVTSEGDIYDLTAGTPKISQHLDFSTKTVTQ